MLECSAPKAVFQLSSGVHRHRMSRFCPHFRSFVGFDIRRSPLVLIVSSVLVLSLGRERFQLSTLRGADNRRARTNHMCLAQNRANMSRAFILGGTRLILNSMQCCMRGTQQKTGIRSKGVLFQVAHIGRMLLAKHDRYLSKRYFILLKPPRHANRVHLCKVSSHWLSRCLSPEPGRAGLCVPAYLR